MYAQMTTDRPAVRMLEQGEVVSIGLVMFGDEVTWCAISRPGETKKLGFISCEFVEPEKAGGAEAAPVQAAQPKQEIRVREIEAPQPKVRELVEMREIAETPPAIPVVREIEVPQQTEQPVEPDEPAPALSSELSVSTLVGPVVATVMPEQPPAPTVVEPAAAQAIIPADFARGALEVSALKSQIAQFVRVNYVMSFLDKKRLSSVDLGVLGEVFHKHFRPGLFQWPVQALLQKEAQTPEAVLLSEWLNDPVTLRMEGLVREAAAPSAHGRLVEYAAKMRKSPPSQERLHLIHRLYAATQACDIEVETTLAAVRALAESLNPLLPEDSQFGGAELARALQDVRKAYQPVMKNAKLVHYLFALEPATNEELEEYVKGWESAGGRWWVAIQRKAFASGTRTLAVNLRSAVPKALGTSVLAE